MAAAHGFYAKSGTCFVAVVTEESVGIGDAVEDAKLHAAAHAVKFEATGNGVVAHGLDVNGVPNGLHCCVLSVG